VGAPCVALAGRGFTVTTWGAPEVALAAVVAAVEMPAFMSAETETVLTLCATLRVPAKETEEVACAATGAPPTNADALNAPTSVVAARSVDAERSGWVNLENQDVSFM
jgi:hypothetical protein